MAGIDYAHQAAAIVRDAGGCIIGRTKFQKIAFFLEAAGVGSGFPFRYKHYGPYSELLAAAAQHAAALRLIIEDEAVASWGGSIRSSARKCLPISLRIPLALGSRRKWCTLMLWSLNLRPPPPF